MSVEIGSCDNLPGFVTSGIGLTFSEHPSPGARSKEDKCAGSVTWYNLRKLLYARGQENDRAKREYFAQR